MRRGRWGTMSAWEEEEMAKDIDAANRFITKSALERGVEIEMDFYHLKAQEWAVSYEEAKRFIEDKMRELSAQIKDWRSSGED